jgi:hypothetical protein
MNNKYKSLNYQATDICIEKGFQGAWTWEKTYAELIIKECLSQMSDYLEKERVKKHFGMEE